LKEEEPILVGVNDQSSRSITANTGKTVPESQAKKPLVPFVVYSQPTGAIVYLDGQNKGLTPYRGWLEADHAVKLTIVKEGFLPYDKGELKTSTSEGVTVRATLQPEPPMGFIAIDIINGGSEPVLTVNGQRLSEKPPIQRYQVPAGLPVKVRAYNPISQLYAEETINVGVGQRKSIRLILGRTGNTQ
jgi:PEGA domain